MSNTVIQIKRSTSNAAPLLQPGELAYTSNGEILFVGSPVGSNTANVVAIAGKRSPGTLTANQALVANNSSWIDAVQTAKLIIGSAGESINVTSISTDGTIDGSNNSGTVLLTANAVKSYVDAYGFTGINTSDGSNSNTILSGDTLTIQGTTNEVEVTLSGDTFTVGLPDTVIITTDIQIGANVELTNVGLVAGNSSYDDNADVWGSLDVGGTTTISNNFNVSGVANLASANISGTLAAGNTTITGDLTVTGTVTTVDTTNLVIEDSLIRLARNQANTGTFVDAVDIGFYGVYGNTSESYYTGLARESGTSNFVLFANNSANPDNDGVETTNTLASLYAYLNSGALVTNATTIAITANSTVNVAIVANTLTLSTPLGVSSGGLGVSSLTANGVLAANSSGGVTSLTSSTEGHVLQIVSGAPTFAHLDGGTF